MPREVGATDEVGATEDGSKEINSVSWLVLVFCLAYCLACLSETKGPYLWYCAKLGTKITEAIFASP